METEPDRDQLAWMYRQMLRIREFEERVKATFTEHPDVIRGHTHVIDVVDPAGAEFARSAESECGSRAQPGMRRRRRTTVYVPLAAYGIE